jgi:hypothetical protein
MHKQLSYQHLKCGNRVDAEKRLEAMFLTLCETINTPRSLTASILFRNKEFAQLVSLECNPLHYQFAYQFSNDYLVSKFLSKYPNFNHPDLNPREKALADFREYEVLCKQSNQKFKALREDPHLWDPVMREVFSLARRKIARVLGTLDLDLVAEHFGWGPGATTATEGNAQSAYVKFSKRLDVTGNALMMGRCCVNSIPSWLNLQLETDEQPSIPCSILDAAFNRVQGNEIVLVPKNAKTHRVIAKEPHVNSFLQKGFGAYIRKRLRVFAGIDLNDQSRNQRLALEGSLTGALATIDLSGASDTISKELVYYLLPEQWYLTLASLRCPFGLLDGQWVFYEKFSSMGNAYTFELESLIFWALADSAVTIAGGDRTVSVYGDDIIVPSTAYDLVATVISYAGFRVNDKKSFSSGPFRESCGRDYFFGTLVRPIFLKEELSDVPSLYRLANSIRRYSTRTYLGSCDARFRQCWKQVVNFIPATWRSYRIPEGYGDVGLLSNFDEAVPSLIRRSSRGWEGYSFSGLIEIPSKRQMTNFSAGYTALLSASRSYRNQSDSEAVSASVRAGIFDSQPLQIDEVAPLRGQHTLRTLTRPKVARIHARSWHDLGPWQ